MRMTTKVAFEKVLSQRGIHHRLGLEQNTVATLRRNYKEGKVSLNKMEEILLKAGLEVVQEKLWE
jgi:hypothetical protein